MIFLTDFMLRKLTVSYGKLTERSFSGQSDLVVSDRQKNDTFFDHKEKTK